MTSHSDSSHKGKELIFKRREVAFEAPGVEITGTLISGKSKAVSMRHWFPTSTFFALMFVLVVPARATPPWDIESGFRLLYETKFVGARLSFLNWEKANPQDPVGHAWEAASYLFEEFYRQGVLTSEFFLDDRRFLEGAAGKPNNPDRVAFLAATTTAQELATRQLKANPRDAEALLALTITNGMLADYASLIDKRQIDSLRFVRQSETYAHSLLEVKPDSADAYLALGAANYIIGSLPAHKRLFLWLGGIRGNKQLGMTQLAVAAKQGDYLRPFAKILLALAELREKQPESARRLLQELTAEFPQNPLFAHELDLLGESKAGGSTR